MPAGRFRNFYTAARPGGAGVISPPILIDQFQKSLFADSHLFWADDGGQRTFVQLGAGVRDDRDPRSVGEFL